MHSAIILVLICFFEAHQGLEELLEEIRNGPEKQEEEEGKKEGAAEGCEGGSVSRQCFVCRNHFHVLHLRSLV